MDALPSQQSTARAAPSGPHRDLIQALGGSTKLAAALRARLGAEEKGPTQHTVSMWLRRGVAWRYRPHVASLAAERGVDLPADFWRPVETAGNDQ